jgi:hypothetical protein
MAKRKVYAGFVPSATDMRLFCHDGEALFHKSWHAGDEPITTLPQASQLFCNL